MQHTDICAIMPVITCYAAGIVCGTRTRIMVSILLHPAIRANATSHGQGQFQRKGRGGEEEYQDCQNHFHHARNIAQIKSRVKRKILKYGIKKAGNHSRPVFSDLGGLLHQSAIDDGLGNLYRIECSTFP